jgi:circadian clock protein KaiB
MNMKTTNGKNGKAKRKSGGEIWNLRLYIAGETSRSIAALSNLQKICDEHLAGKYHVEVVDLLKNPQLAAGDHRGRAHPRAPAAPASEEDHWRFVELPATHRWARFASRKDFVMTAQSLKRAIASAASYGQEYVLRLYVTGATARSRRAIVNINAICREHLQGKYDLEVIDIHQKPALAKDEQIVAAPTLIKQLPLPLRRIIGDLSDRESVLFGLDLKRRT